MDDVQRGLVGGFGVALMGGAIAWVSTVSFAPGHSASVRVLVPGVMFLVGAALVVWAIRSKPTTQRDAPITLSGTLRPERRRPDEPSASDAELVETIRTLCDDIDTFIEQESKLGIDSYAGAVKRELIARYQESGLRTRVFWVANQLHDRGFIDAKRRERLHWQPINPGTLAGKRDELMAHARLMGGF
jgi:hypothetical protein